MNANYQHLSFETDKDLIQCYWVKTDKFGFHWHYHHEYEITCVKHGRGTRLVGDHVNNFEDGDFVFLGSNLPHTWISDDDFNQSNEEMEVAVLQFHPSVFPPGLLRLPEMKNIRRLLEESDRGIRISGRRNSRATQMMYELIEKEGFERYALFLALLNLIGEETDFIKLASKSYIPPLNGTTEERILNVCRFVHQEFTQPIQLDEVARIANMNPTSFCRFFKKSTGQTLFEYISDLRIGKACNLLIDKRKLSVTEVAYQSGFNSQTLFNRIFRAKKKMTPVEFRKRMRG